MKGSVTETFEVDCDLDANTFQQQRCIGEILLDDESGYLDLPVYVFGATESQMANWELGQTIELEGRLFRPGT